MAACTRTEHSGVINARDWRPATGAMTVGARIGRSDVSRTFTRRRNPIVAARAIGAGITVIEHGRGPVGGVMAITTAVATGDVIGRFAGCRGSVMAACTGAEYSVVVDARDRRPCGGAVTIGAAVGG